MLGLFVGAVMGGILGVGLGFVWTTIDKTTGFEGYSGMLVFYAFMPLGALAGGLFGAVLLGMFGVRK